MGILATKQNYLAFDFGSSRLKIVEVTQSQAVVKLNNFIVKEIDFALYSKDNFKRGEMIKLLEPIFKQLSFKGTKNKLILSGSNLITKILTLPKVENHKVKELIFWEVEDILSMPREELVIDYQILLKKEEKLEVLLAVAYKDLILKQMNLLDQLGCQIEQIEAAPLNFKNILNQELIRENLAIIDIGAQKTELSVLKQGEFDFRRVFKLGGNDFTLEIQDKKELTYREAEKLKQDSRVEFDLIDTTLTKLLKKISLSIHYWQQKGAKIDRLILTGGGSKLKGLDQFISHKLNLKVSLLAGLSKFEFAVEDVNFHLLKEKLPYLSLSLASVLKDE